MDDGQDTCRHHTYTRTQEERVRPKQKKSDRVSTIEFLRRENTNWERQQQRRLSVHMCMDAYVCACGRLHSGDDDNVAGRILAGNRRR